jgi:large subunit ribosomal protein L25
MSNEDFTLTAESRSDLGKGASRRLRHENKVPAVIYGGNGEPQSLTVDHDALFHQLENEAFYSSILTIKVDGKGQKAVLKDLQRHPAKPIIMHADFMRILANEKLRMSIPIHFLNEEYAPGVKIDGGMISHNISEVEVSCLPKDLPEYLEVDMGSLEMDESRHLSDIIVPEGVELVELMHGEDHDQPIASIHKTRAVEETEDEDAVAPPEATTEEEPED